MKLKSLLTTLFLLVLNVSSNPSGKTIHLNTVGYLSDSKKIVTISAMSEDSFSVIDDTGTEILTGDLVAQSPRVKFADISRFKTEGHYSIRLGNGEESLPFQISDSIYIAPFKIAVEAMYMWRCGTEVSLKYNNQLFQRPVCHKEDAYTDYIGEKGGTMDTTGGWHDAGDYNKYITNASLTLYSMLQSWIDFSNEINSIDLNIPGDADCLPAFLREIKWETDWFLKMQDIDGSVFHKVSTLNFGSFIASEDEVEPRYVVPFGTTSTSDFVGSMAMASRVFSPYCKQYANRCLEAALRSYHFLQQTPEYVPADQSAFTTGTYESDDTDDRLWAAAEVWEATGDIKALTDVEKRIQERSGKFDIDFDWHSLGNLGLLTYLFSNREGRSTTLIDLVRSELLLAADSIVNTAQLHLYGRTLGDTYYWGCNGTVVRQVHILHAAWRVDPDPKYKDTILDSLNHIFGRNLFARSYVTGVGGLPPMNPHDRRSSSDEIDSPWPGYLVGGPNPNPEDWSDTEADYRTNEIAINWNGALIYALASVLQ